MNARQTEVETKLIAPSPKALGDLPQHLRTLARQIRMAPHEKVKDRYLDTRNHVLLHAGAACRLREVNGHSFLTLKSLAPPQGRLSYRQETEEPLPAPPSSYPSRVPGPQTARQLRPLIGTKRLHVLFEVEQDRDVWHVRTRHGDQLRVSGDYCVWYVGGRSRAREASVEIELERGSPESLASFAEALRKRTGFGRARQSKFLRGLTLIGCDVPIYRDDPATALHPKDRFGTVAWKTLQRHLARMVWNAPGATLGLDPERLHDLRVAIRRLRSALRWFEGGIPARSAQRLQADLRWLADATGRLRDLDVMLQNWPTAVAAVKPPHRACLQPLEDHLKTQYQHAQHALLSALGSSRFARFLDDSQRWLDGRAPPSWLRTRFGRQLAIDVACRRLRQRLKRTLKRGRKITAHSPPERYHRLRISLKRLRYGLEFFAPILGSPCRDGADNLVKLQDIAGSHQDAAVAINFVQEALAQLAQANAHSPRLFSAVADLLNFYAQTAADARRKFLKAWRRFDRKKTLRPLVKLLR